MQKDNIISIEHPEGEGSIITYTDNLPQLNVTQGVPDILTIEVDMGTDVIYSGGKDWVVEKKLNSIAPVEEQEPWVLTYEMGEQLKPLVEKISVDSNNFTAGCAYMFSNSNLVSADLSSWERISNPEAALAAFQYSKRLSSVKFDSLVNITVYAAASNMFSNCKVLQSVSMPLLRSVDGYSACSSIFQDCISLQSVSMPSLQSVSGQYVCSNMFINCTALQRVNLSSLQNTSGGGAMNGMFNNCTALRELHIGVGALSANNSNSPIWNLTTAPLSDLYLYGTPLNNIYINTLPLSFDSVLRVLHLIADDENAATQKTLSLKSGLSFQVSQEEADDYNAALTTVRTTKGWTVQNAPTVTVQA